MVQKLEQSYYLNKDVVFLAQNLIGKVICTKIKGEYCTGIISETEAYNGTSDKASHAYNNRRTARTEIMFGNGGFSYVYLCYGIHKLFNVVCSPKDIPNAVLIRGIIPLEGTEIMEKRRNKDKEQKGFSNGPGTLTIALAIEMEHNKIDLTGDNIWIENREIQFPENEIQIGPRIGIDYAEEDKSLPYRFLLNKNSIQNVDLHQ